MHGGVVVIERAILPNDAGPARGLFALALAVLLHAALLNSVLRHSGPAIADSAPDKTMLWLKLAPPLHKPVPRPILPAAPDQPKRSADKAAPAAAPAQAPVAVPQAVPAIAAPPEQALTARIGAEEIMRIAKQDLGKIDRELRKGNKDAFSASGDSAQRRLEKAFDEAHAAVPNKWYQAAKVEDITPPGDDARKIYKVTTAFGTYCVRYKDKNRAFDQGAANLGEPLTGACPHMFKGP